MQTTAAHCNGLCPTLMTPEARICELGQIIATSVLRMRELSSHLSAAHADSSLGSPAYKSVSHSRHEACSGER
jgi:hypothetical protein